MADSVVGETHYDGQHFLLYDAKQKLEQSLSPNRQAALELGRVLDRAGLHVVHDRVAMLMAEAWAQASRAGWSADMFVQQIALWVSQVPQGGNVARGG